MLRPRAAAAARKAVEPIIRTVGFCVPGDAASALGGGGGGGGVAAPGGSNAPRHQPGSPSPVIIPPALTRVQNTPPIGVLLQSTATQMTPSSVSDTRCSSPDSARGDVSLDSASQPCLVHPMSPVSVQPVRERKTGTDGVNAPKTPGDTVGSDNTEDSLLGVMQPSTASRSIEEMLRRISDKAKATGTPGATQRVHTLVAECFRQVLAVADESSAGALPTISLCPAGGRTQKRRRDCEEEAGGGAEMSAVGDGRSPLGKRRAPWGRDASGEQVEWRGDTSRGGVRDNS